MLSHPSAHLGVLASSCDRGIWTNQIVCLFYPYFVQWNAQAVWRNLRYLVKYKVYNHQKYSGAGFKFTFFIDLYNTILKHQNYNILVTDDILSLLILILGDFHLFPQTVFDTERKRRDGSFLKKIEQIYKFLYDWLKYFSTIWP